MSLPNISDNDYFDQREDPADNRPFRPQEDNEPEDIDRMRNDRAPAKRSNKEKLDQQLFADLSTAPGKPLFKIGMQEKEVKVRLFMLEEEPGFKDLSSRAKFNIIARRSVFELQEWYFELGSRDSLPVRYDYFRKMFVEKCIECGLSKIRKFRDEKWSEYISRLQLLARQSKIAEAEILKETQNRGGTNRTKGSIL